MGAAKGDNPSGNVAWSIARSLIKGAVFGGQNVKGDLKQLFAPVKALIQKKVASVANAVKGPLEKLKTSVKKYASLMTYSYRTLHIDLELSKDIDKDGAKWEYSIDAAYRRHWSSNLKLAVPGAGEAEAQVSLA